MPNRICQWNFWHKFFTLFIHLCNHDHNLFSSFLPCFLNTFVAFLHYIEQQFRNILCGIVPSSRQASGVISVCAKLVFSQHRPTELRVLHREICGGRPQGVPHPYRTGWVFEEIRSDVQCTASRNLHLPCQ